MQITRAVITDLWHLEKAGEASADSRALVMEFLAGDLELSRSLGESGMSGTLVSDAYPHGADHDAKVGQRVGGRMAQLAIALLFSLSALSHLWFDVKWTARPTGFVVSAIAAFLAWLAFVARFAYESRPLQR